MSSDESRALTALSLILFANDGGTEASRRSLRGRTPAGRRLLPEQVLVAS